MKSTVLLLVCVALSSSVVRAADGELSSRSDAIINGQSCPADIHPATVAVLVDGEVNVLAQQQIIKTFTCTGTLIAPDVVMTAAHCVDMSLFTLGVGHVRRQKYAITFEADLTALSAQTTTMFPADAIFATRWVPHPKYSLTRMGTEPGPGDYCDIALLFLERPVMHVQPALVITADEASQLQVGRVVEISGWGMTSPQANGGAGRKVCATSFIAELGTSEMQIGREANTARKCHGDSGGPSYLNVDTPHDVKQRVVGVTSHGYDARNCNYGGLDTRVDVYREWLEAELERGCRSGRRSWCAVPGLITPDLLDDGKTLPLDDGLGGDAERGCGCDAASTGLLALVVAMLLSRRRVG